MSRVSSLPVPARHPCQTEAPDHGLSLHTVKERDGSLANELTSENSNKHCRL